MNRSCVILNPFARGARGGDLPVALARMGRGMVVRTTEAAGHAEVLAREAVQEGFETVVAAGGDGTLNEVLAGLDGAAVPLGVLPLGTMNVFAREHGIPLDWEDALARILRGRVQRVDLGDAGGMPFAQLAGVGFDARVIEGVSSRAKRIWGAAAYGFAAIREMTRSQAPLKVTAEGFPAQTAEWVLVGLGRFYGGGFSVFPRGNPTDGLLDVLLVKRLSPWLGVGALAGVPWGLHTRLPGVEYVQTRRLRVEGEAGWELDGEWRGGGTVEFSVKPRALQVLL